MEEYLRFIFYLFSIRTQKSIFFFCMLLFISLCDYIVLLASHLKNKEINKPLSYFSFKLNRERRKKEIKICVCVYFSSWNNIYLSIIFSFIHSFHWLSSLNIIIRCRLRKRKIFTELLYNTNNNTWEIKFFN